MNDDQRINRLEDHLIRQIDENRKISHRVDELEKMIEAVRNHARHELEMNFEALHDRLVKSEKRIEDLEEFKHVRFRLYDHKPYKCPLCEGRRIDIFLREMAHYHGEQDLSCKACEGKGILWG